MNQATSLSRPIVEGLYTEALVLADEVRSVFGRPSRDVETSSRAGKDQAGAAHNDSIARLALSTEGLKTTTRMMHVLAWLLNQRAYFSGELSERQVRMHGALPVDRPSDAEQLMLLDAETRNLIGETERLHRRIARLDSAQRGRFASASPVKAFQERIGRELNGF